MIPLLAVQSCAQTFIHNAIMLIDTSDNASYNQVHGLIRTPYLSIKASNGTLQANSDLDDWVGLSNFTLLLFRRTVR